MTKPHPLFDQNSSCRNCAAFHPWHNGVDRQDGPQGSCHRHAPRPPSEMKTYDREGLLTGSMDSAWQGVVWPIVDGDDGDDPMFCCEWLPKATRPIPPKAPVPLSDLDLSTRTRNAINSALAIRTAQELADQHVAELLRYRNFGRASLAEVRRELAKHGLSLRGELPRATAESPACASDRTARPSTS